MNRVPGTIVMMVFLSAGLSAGLVSREEAAVSLNRVWAERALSGKGGGEIPFSFTYDGRPSSEFLRKWQVATEGKAIDETRFARTAVWTDLETGLEVRAAAVVYLDTAGVDWTLAFTNHGSKDTPILEKVMAVDVGIPVGKPETTVVIHRLNGGPSRADDWLPFDEPLPAEESREFATYGGRSSNVCPFFNISWGTEGIITAIGWSGQWAAGVDRNVKGDLRIRAGMESLHVRLRPGESIRSPRIMQLRWAGSDVKDSYNLFRKTMLVHILPRIDGKLVTPPITTPSPWMIQDGDFWKYAYEFTEGAALDEIKWIDGLGYEYYWTDAYFTRGNFPDGMGNYGLPLLKHVPDPVRFPRGLRPVSDAAHAAGMNYVVWFEPERVMPGTTIADEHPEYVIRREGKKTGLLNLGLPEAREYIFRVLDTVIKEWRMDCLRIDYNIDPLPYWRIMDAKDPDRVGMAEIRYIEGFYRLWDDILKANPGIFIDNCASGGRRIDLETCSRSIPLWRTDGVIEPYLRLDYDQTALQNQIMTGGLNRYLPYSTSGSIGAKPYYFRSGFNYGVPIAERPRAEEKDLLKQGIAEGKRLRKYWLGDFYPLSPVTTNPEDWCVFQYHRPEERDGLIVALKRPKSPFPAFILREIRGIDPDADYQVRISRTYEPSAPVTMKGSVLMAFRIEIDESPGSMVLEYRAVAR